MSLGLKMPSTRCKGKPMMEGMTGLGMESGCLGRSECGQGQLH
jgi:hypothetical protein